MTTAFARHTIAKRILQCVDLGVVATVTVIDYCPVHEYKLSDESQYIEPRARVY